MIHSTAIIEDGAVISESATVGAFCHIAKDIHIGAGVILEPHVTIKDHVTIKADTHIYSFAKIGNGTIPIVIDTGCIIREFCQIGMSSDSYPNSKLPIIINSDCYIMGHVQIYAGVTVKSNCILTMNVILNESSICNTRVIMGAKSTLAKNCTIGTGSMVGAISHVKRDMPPFTLIEGYPEANIKGLNSIGMRRNFEDRSSINSVKRVFIELKKSSFSAKTALAMLPNIQDKYAREFVSFVSQSRCS